MIAAGRYSDAYMINWQSNVFPGILGRTCDRPCEPACRRGRVEDGDNRGTGGKAEPVAICRLKRVAADLKDDIRTAFEANDPDVLVLDYVLLSPRWRGLKLGLLAVRKALALAGVGQGVAFLPAKGIFN